MGNCWEYLAEAIAASRGCRCGHSKERHTRHMSRTEELWRTVNGIVRPVQSMDVSETACTLCDCFEYWWDGERRWNDPPGMIYPDCAA